MTATIRLDVIRCTGQFPLLSFSSIFNPHKYAPFCIFVDPPGGDIYGGYFGAFLRIEIDDRGRTDKRDIYIML